MPVITIPPPNGYEFEGDDFEFDYAVADFLDLNDGDAVSVRWDAHRHQAYMFSELDRRSQWIGDDWTIRKTIEIGLGRLNDLDPISVEEMTIFHNDRLNANGEAEIVFPDFQEVQRILSNTWSSYGVNRIVLTFKAE